MLNNFNKVHSHLDRFLENLWLAIHLLIQGILFRKIWNISCRLLMENSISVIFLFIHWWMIFLCPHNDLIVNNSSMLKQVSKFSLVIRSFESLAQDIDNIWKNPVKFTLSIKRSSGLRFEPWGTPWSFVPLYVFRILTVSNSVS